MKHFIKYLSILILLSVYQNANAQCKWDIVINPASIIESNCAKNGGFTVTLTGSNGNATDLSNVNYSATGPTTVNSNSSSIFTEMSAGTYTVTVTAICSIGGGGETKTTTVVVPGNYIPPSTPTYSVRRNALDCGTGNYGRVLLSSITGSAKPYKIKMTVKPDAYLGPTEFSTSNSQFFINDLSAGDYSFILEDDCNTSTAQAHVVIKELVLAANLPMARHALFSAATSKVLPCNTVSIYCPIFASSDWIGYNEDDTPLEYAVSIDDGAYSNYFPLVTTQGTDIALPLGKTVKDYYNKYNFAKARIRVKTNPACMITMDGSVNSTYFKPYVSANVNKNCTDFSLRFGVSSNMVTCFPINVNLKKSGDPIGENYVLNYPNSITTGALAFGTYTATYVTADGYTWSSAPPITVNAPSISPYSIAIDPSSAGLHMYVGNFRIQRENNELIKKGTKIELVTGPNGYSYSALYTSVTHYHDMPFNQGVPANSHLYRYIAGSYTWRVTDDCGVYDINITVKESDMHKYTLDVSNQTRTCNSLTVKPTGTYTYNNVTKDANFRIISGPGSFLQTVITPGQSFVLTTPGEYEIMALADNSASGQYSPHERRSEKVIFVNDPIKINDAVSQGFACVGAADNEGQIVVRAMGASGDYLYNLHASESDAQSDANLILSNTTGDFPPTLGLMKNQTYYVKIIDDCSFGGGSSGVYTIQAITILNLKNTKIVSANSNNICEGEELRLSALVLPSGTYSWVGPNGFTSSQQNPVRSNMSLLDAGDYIVTIQSGYCALDTKDTIKIKVQTCIAAVDDNINVLACQKVSFDPTINDVFTGANLSIAFNPPGKGTISNIGNNAVYTNTSCVKGKDEFTYTICKDNGASCSTAKVYVNIMAMPQIVMLQNCSFKPQIAIDLQYKDAVCTWERSDDGTSDWTSVSTSNFILNVIDEGYYRVKIKIPGMDEAITTVKHVKMKKVVINNSNWYEIWFE